MVASHRIRSGSRRAGGSGSAISTTAPRWLATVAAAGCSALVLASGAPAAPASAATIVATKACYIDVKPTHGAPMTLIGTGFFPGDSVHVAGGTVLATATVAAGGAFAVTTAAPVLATAAPGFKRTVLVATDANISGARLTATTIVKSANLAVQPRPISVRRPKRDKVTFSFSGFRPGRHIYAYYSRRKVVVKAKFGRPNRPCGLLRQKALLYPGGRLAGGKYTVTFEQSSRYSKNVLPRVTGVLSVIRF